MAELVTLKVVIEIAASAIIFLALWGFLSRAVFGPIIDVLEEREARTTGDKQQAKDAIAEASDLQTELEQRLFESRVEALRLRDDIVGQAEGEAGRIIMEAQTQAEQKLEAARADIERARQSVSGELESQAAELAETLVGRIMSSGSQPAVH